MEVILTNNELLERIQEEVSRVADRAYAESGVSLYETIRIIEQDIPTVLRMVDKYVNEFLSVFRDEVAETKESNSIKLELNLPDIPAQNEALAKETILQYLSLGATLEWLTERNPNYAEIYQAKKEAQLAYLKNLLYQRKRIEDDV